MTELMLDEQALLKSTVAQARHLTGLPVVFGGPVNQAGVVLTESSGMRTRALHNLVVETQRGLGGHALQARKPVSVTHYRSSAAISHDYDREVAAEGLVSLVAIPVLAGQQVRAVLYGALRDPHPIGDLAADKLVAAAAQLSAALRARGGPGAGAARPAAPPALASIVAEARTLAEQVGDARLKSEILACCARYAQLRSNSPGPAGIPALTSRELEVVALTAAGCSNQEIARELAVTTATVKAYMRSAMRRLGARTRYAAVSAARAHGLLP
jgi:DNA-binding CsgD family transcriptional regulator